VEGQIERVVREHECSPMHTHAAFRAEILLRRDQLEIDPGVRPPAGWPAWASAADGDESAAIASVGGR